MLPKETFSMVVKSSKCICIITSHFSKDIFFKNTAYSNTGHVLPLVCSVEFHQKSMYRHQFFFISWITKGYQCQNKGRTLLGICLDQFMLVRCFFCSNFSNGLWSANNARVCVLQPRLMVGGATPRTLCVCAPAVDRRVFLLTAAIGAEHPWLATKHGT